MQTQPVTNPTPKARFMESNDSCSKHRTMIDSNEFQRAADFAMLEYQARIATQTEPQAAAVMGLKVMGALEFLQTLRNLAEPAQRVIPLRPQDNLNHNAK